MCLVGWKIVSLNAGYLNIFIKNDFSLWFLEKESVKQAEKIYFRAMKLDKVRAVIGPHLDQLHLGFL